MNLRGIAVLALAFAADLAAADPAAPIGIVVMHGKADSPVGLVAPLVGALELQGYLVANLEMPWSVRRNYDTGVAQTDAEVAAAIGKLRARGAQRVFVAGHSIGGAYVFHYGTLCGCDGIISIAGGSVATTGYGKRLFADYVERARQLIAEGKGNQRSAFIENLGGQRGWTIYTTPVNYLDWFAFDGPMNIPQAIHAMNPALPVLIVSPTGDGQMPENQGERLFAQLPPNPLNRIVRPSGDHLSAPLVSIDAIARWTHEVAAAR
jgi:pimeloyl-ACP methyl ester carboxylesterase